MSYPTCDVCQMSKLKRNFRPDLVRCLSCQDVIDQAIAAEREALAQKLEAEAEAVLIACDVWGWRTIADVFQRHAAAIRARSKP